MGVDFRTQAIHAGYEPLDNGRAAVPPIYASAAFDLGDAARGDALAGGDIDGFEYSRVANPTVDALEKRLAALEDGIGAVAVGSGMAAAYWLDAALFYKKPACTHSEQLYTYAYDVYRFVLNADTMEITSRGRGRFRRG